MTELQQAQPQIFERQSRIRHHKPTKIESRISQPAASQLNELGKAMLNFTSIVDLTNWFAITNQS